MGDDKNPTVVDAALTQACAYRATHEFGADGFCNHCFKAKLVVEKELAALRPAPKLDEPQVQELPNGWNTTLPINGVFALAGYANQQSAGALAQLQGLNAQNQNAQSLLNGYAQAAGLANQQRLMPMQELSQLQGVVAGLQVKGVEPSRWTLERIAELQREYHPYTKAGLDEEEARRKEYAAKLDKQDACEHRMLKLSECGYEGDCLTCGKVFDEVDLDDLKAERAHLEKVQLTASAKLTSLLAPALFSSLEKIAQSTCPHVDKRHLSINSDAFVCNSCGATITGLEMLQAAHTEPDGVKVKCGCGKTFPDLGALTKHLQDCSG